MKKSEDILISWPSGSSNLNKIIKWRSIHLYAFPSMFDIKKNRVGIVQDGKIVLIFKVKRVFKSSSLTIATSNNKLNFKKSTGYKLFFNKSSLVYVNILCKQIRFESYGQFRYFDIENDIAKYLSQSKIDDNNTLNNKEQKNTNVFFSKPFNEKFLSKSRTPAEYNLINAYVTYCNLENYAMHPYIKSDKVYADLLIKSTWRLIEAKATLDRKTIRQAVGQLFDYKRQFSRKPSLGLLLPEKPSKAILKYLKYYKITAIWRTKTGLFGDSNNGNWSTTLK